MIDFIRNLDAGMLFVLAGGVALVILAGAYAALSLLNKWLS